jgi:hypothetical protein
VRVGIGVSYPQARLPHQPITPRTGIGADYNFGDPPMSLTAGVRLGPYEILSAIAAGGTRQIYKNRCAQLNSSCLDPQKCVFGLENQLDVNRGARTDRRDVNSGRVVGR